MLWDRKLLVQDSISMSTLTHRFSSTELSSSSALIAFLKTSAAQMTPGCLTTNIASAIQTFIAAKVILGPPIATVSVTVKPNAVQIVCVSKKTAAILDLNAVLIEETRGLQTVIVLATVDSIAVRMTPIRLTQFTAPIYAFPMNSAVPDRPGEEISFVHHATREKNVARVTSGPTTNIVNVIQMNYAAQMTPVRQTAKTAANAAIQNISAAQVTAVRLTSKNATANANQLMNAAQVTLI